MNSLLAMVTELSLKPDQPTAVRALIDCAEEQLELTHNAAVRYAVGVRRQAKFDLLCAQAKPIIEIESKYYIDIREHVRDALSLPTRTYISMTLHRTRAPIIMLDDFQNVSDIVGISSHVAVGMNPGFVLRLRKILDQLDQEDREDLDRARRHRRGHRGGQHSAAS